MKRLIFSQNGLIVTMLATGCVIVMAAGCSKTSSDKASPAASTSAAPVAAASSAAPPSSATAQGAEGSAWSGSYVAKVGPVVPPEAAKEKAWTNDPGTAAVGQGTIKLSVSGPRGDTQGDLTGPLGDLKISGVFDGTELRANLMPKDPKGDEAMTGFMLLGASGAPPSALKGTLRVSNRDARIVREASVELAKK